MCNRTVSLRSPLANVILLPYFFFFPFSLPYLTRTLLSIFSLHSCMFFLWFLNGYFSTSYVTVFLHFSAPTFPNEGLGSFFYELSLFIFFVPTGTNRAMIIPLTISPGLISSGPLFLFFFKLWGRWAGAHRPSPRPAILTAFLELCTLSICFEGKVAGSWRSIQDCFANRRVSTWWVIRNWWSCFYLSALLSSLLYGD